MQRTPFSSLIASMALLAMSLSGAPQMLAAATDPTPWPMIPKGEAADERVLWNQLENGLRYALMPADPEERMISIRLVVETGSAYDPAGKSGLAQFVERMAFAGAESVDRATLFRLFQRNGMGYPTGGGTGLKHTVYRFDLDHCTEADLKTAFEFIVDLGSGVRFDPEVVERERAAFLRAIKDGQAGLRNHGARHDQLIYSDSSFPESTSDEVVRRGVESISPAELEAFWRAWYRPERMALFVTGNIDAGNLESIVKQFLEPIKGEGTKPQSSAARSGKTRKPGSIDVHNTTERASQVAAAYFTEPMDFYDPDQERLLYRAEVLGRYAQSRLNSSRSYDYDAVDVHDGRVLIHFGERGSVMQLEEQIRKVDQLAHNLSLNGIAKEELAGLKEAMLLKLSGYLSSFSEREWPPVVADRLVSCFIDRTPFRSGPAHGTYARGIIDGLDHALANSLCAEFFDPKRLNLVVNMPEGLKITSRKIAKRLKSVRPSYNFAWNQNPGVSWRVKEGVNEIGMVTSSQRIELGRYHAFQYVLQNRLRVNLVQTDSRPGSFSARLSIGNGLADLNESFPGAGWLMEAALRQMRMDQQKTSPALYDVLGAKGLESLEVGASVGQIYWGATGSSQEQLYNFLSLLTEWVVSGQLSEDDFTKLKETMTRLATDGGPISPVGKIEKMLMGEETRMRSQFTKEEVDAIEYKDISEWLQSVRSNGYLELTIVGDVETRSVLRDVRKTLGGLPTREGKVIQPRHGAPVRYPEPGVSSGTYAGGGDIAFASLIWPSPSQEDCVSELRLRVLRTLLDREIKELLREKGMETVAANMYLIGYDMIPGSRSARLDLNGPKDKVESLQERILDLAQGLVDGLDADTLAAVERAELLALQRADLSNVLLLRMLDQSQGRPASFNCTVELMSKGINSTVEDYRSLARSTFDRSNVRGAIVTPAN